MTSDFWLDENDGMNFEGSSESGSAADVTFAKLEPGRDKEGLVQDALLDAVPARRC